MGHDLPGQEQLLIRYRASRNASDFEAIVARYAGMVIGVAQRRTGDRGLAEEVAQNVFVLLVKKADQIAPANLAGWLHRTALLDASNALRKETRRKKKLEAFSHAMKSETTPDSGDQDEWQEILPLLDAAIDTLPTGERKVVLLRFFEKRSFKEIGHELGLGEDAGRKRLNVALKKLNVFLRRRSVVSTTAAVAACLSNQAAHGVTPTLVHSLSQSALAGTASTAVPVSLTGSLINIMTTTKLTAITLVLISAAVPVSVGWMKDENTGATVAETKTITASGENDRASSASTKGRLSPKSSEKRIVDLQMLAREINRFPDQERSLEKELELQLLMFELSEEQILPVLEIIKAAQNPSAIRSINTALFARWAQLDPEQAFTTATDLDNEHLRYAARRGAMETWAADDPDAALAALALDPDGKSNSTLVYSVLSVMARRDREGAMERVSQIADAEVRAELSERLAKFWSQADPEEALKWAQSVDDYALRNRYTKAILDSLATSYPEKSIELALTLDHPHLREESARWALMQWGGRDPDAAIAAYLALPEEVRTKNLTGNVASFMVSGDAARALDIAAKLPEGSPQWAEFVKIGARRMAQAEPEKAAVLAESLPKGRSRTFTLESVANAWLAQDREAALMWIEKTGALSGNKLKKALETN